MLYTKQEVLEMAVSGVWDAIFGFLLNFFSCLQDMPQWKLWYAYIHACSVTKSCWLSTTPWTIAHQAPLSMEFSRQEYCSGLPFPFPGDLPNSGIEPKSLISRALASRFFTTRAPWEVKHLWTNQQNWRSVWLTYYNHLGGPGVLMPLVCRVNIWSLT